MPSISGIRRSEITRSYARASSAESAAFADSSWLASRPSWRKMAPSTLPTAGSSSTINTCAALMPLVPHVPAIRRGRPCLLPRCSSVEPRRREHAPRGVRKPGRVRCPWPWSCRSRRTPAPGPARPCPDPCRVPRPRCARFRCRRRDSSVRKVSTPPFGIASTAFRSKLSSAHRDQVRVGLRARQIRRELEHGAHPSFGRKLLKRDHALHELVDLHCRQCRLDTTQTLVLVDDGGHSLHLFGQEHQKFVEVRHRPATGTLFTQVLDGALQRRQRIFHVVSHLRRESTEDHQSLHPLPLSRDGGGLAAARRPAAPA